MIASDFFVPPPAGWGFGDGNPIRSVDLRKNVSSSCGVGYPASREVLMIVYDSIPIVNGYIIEIQYMVVYVCSIPDLYIYTLSYTFIYRICIRIDRID